MKRQRILMIAAMLTLHVALSQVWAGPVAPSGASIYDDIVSMGGGAATTATHLVWGAAGQAVAGRSLSPSGTLNHGWPSLDKTPPEATLSTAAGAYVVTPTGAITVDLVLSKPVINLTLGSISTENAVASDLTSSDALSHSFTLTPSVEGAFSCWVEADALQDASANGNTASNVIGCFWDATPPTVTIGAPSETITTAGPVSYTVSFADAGSGLDMVTLAADDVSLDVAGSVSADITVSGAGATRTVTLSNITGDGVVGIVIAPGAATDVAGNSAPAAGPGATFIVDNTPPSIDFAEPTLEVECADAVVFPTPTTDDNFGPVTVTITDYDGLQVEAAAVGDYTVEFAAEDGAGNTASTLLTVEVRDTTPPVIAIPGSNPKYVLLGTAYTPPEATAEDACDGPVAATLIDDGGLDTDTLGTYYVVYEARDAADNTATDTLVVHVSGDLPPVITLEGDAEVTLNCGDSYEDAGATAEDDLDGDLTDEIIVTGLPPEDTPLSPGVWTIAYDVSDSGDKPAETVTRTVIVLDDCPLQVAAVTPTSIIKTLGESATFMVEVSGEIGSVSYQWKHSRANKSFDLIIGANHPAYVIDEITEEDAGEYICEVSDAVTTVESDVFTLTIGAGLSAMALAGMAALILATSGVGALIVKRRA